MGLVFFAAAVVVEVVDLIAGVVVDQNHHVYRQASA